MINQFNERYKQYRIAESELRQKIFQNKKRLKVHNVKIANSYKKE